MRVTDLNREQSQNPGGTDHRAPLPSQHCTRHASSLCRSALQYTHVLSEGRPLFLSIKLFVLTHARYRGNPHFQRRFLQFPPFDRCLVLHLCCSLRSLGRRLFSMTRESPHR